MNTLFRNCRKHFRGRHSHDRMAVRFTTT